MEEKIPLEEKNISVCFIQQVSNKGNKMLFFSLDYAPKDHTKMLGGKDPLMAPLLVSTNPVALDSPRAPSWLFPEPLGSALPGHHLACHNSSPTSALPTSNNDMKNLSSGTQETLPFAICHLWCLGTLGHHLHVSMSLECVSGCAVQGLLGLMEFCPVASLKAKGLNSH